MNKENTDPSSNMESEQTIGGSSLDPERPSSDACPKCGKPEVEAFTPRTVYACGSSDYDRRPGTFRKGKNCETRITAIDSGQHASCQLCGKKAELRPYGPNGEFVCFACGMKDEDAAKRQFQKLLDSSDTIIIK